MCMIFRPFRRNGGSCAGWYIQAQKRCKNPISEEFNCINIVENDVNASETGVSVTEMRQRKEKESKVNIQQQQHAREEPKKEPQNLDEERERWKDALLADDLQESYPSLTLV